MECAWVRRFLEQIYTSMVTSPAAIGYLYANTLVAADQRSPSGTPSSLATTMATSLTLWHQCILSQQEQPSHMARQ